MQEIIEHYFPIWNFHQVDRPFDLVIDVGASPGGWTQYLSAISRKVLAIDPGELHDRVLKLDNVVHIAAVIESNFAQAALKNATATIEQNCITACVCDINVSADVTAELLSNHVLSHLRACKETFVVITLKLMKGPKQRHIDYAVTTVINILSKSNCNEFKVVHLNSNSSNERTVVCRLMWGNSNISLIV